MAADTAARPHAALRVDGPLEALIERVGSPVPADDLPVFLPWLAGERTSIWRSDVRGTFAGLGLGRDRGGDTLFWSALEGVAHSLRDILRIAAEASGVTAAEMRISGGGSRSDPRCQLTADVTGLRVVRTDVRETGLISVPRCAQPSARGSTRTFRPPRAMCRIEAAFEPRPALRDLFEHRARRWGGAKQLALELPAMQQ